MGESIIKPKAVIHYLSDLVNNEEYAAMHEYFACTNRILNIHNIGGHDPVVIPRFTVQPQTVKDYLPDICSNYKCSSSLKQYRWVSDIRNWYHDLSELTPKTWFSNEFQYLPKDTAFIVRGTNTSRKDHWDDMMFAADKAQAIKVVGTLYQDGLIGAEDCVVRKFIPFKQYGEGIGGIPIIKEFRLFVFDGDPFYIHYYWCNYPELIPEEEKDISNSWTVGLKECIDKATNIASQHCLFYSLDIAQDVEGKWWVVEVNDGHRSGIPAENAEDYYTFYAGLEKRVQDWIERGCQKP